jgi:hypothetical protein
MVDFNCFQMMMVTRNAELEMEQSGGSGGGGEYGGEDEDDEETQLRRAIELSMAEADGGGESGLPRGARGSEAPHGHRHPDVRPVRRIARDVSRACGSCRGRFNRRAAIRSERATLQERENLPSQ